MNAVLMIKPGPLRDGLNTLLFAMSDVQLVAHPDNNNAAIDFCRKKPGALMILDIRSNDPGLLDTIPEMKERCPLGRVVALIHTESDLPSAEVFGADFIMGVGTRAYEVKAGIEEMGRSSAETS